MITFREVKIDDADLILRWRMSQHVTKYMNTDVTHDSSSQKNWLSSCYSKNSYYHWIILNEKNPIGLINLENFSEKNKTTSWGFYIGEQGLNGYGAFIPPYFYNFLFYTLNIEKIEVEVFYNNPNVIGLHLLHGYKFAPTKDRVIQKNGKDILLVAMSLDKCDWNVERFGKNKAIFPVEKWKTRPSSLS